VVGGVIASAGDRAWGHVRQHAHWIGEWPTAHSLDAEGTRAYQSKVPDVEVVTVPVLPEHRQRARVSPEETDTVRILGSLRQWTLPADKAART